jgi:hypothetical protein
LTLPVELDLLHSPPGAPGVGPDLARLAGGGALLHRATGIRNCHRGMVRR